jgi:hypothetical protein
MHGSLKECATASFHLSLVAAAFALAMFAGSGQAADRPVTHQTAAWWTFDNHLRDEVHGLALTIRPHPDKDTEQLYSDIQYLLEVPLLEVGGKTNWRSFYRWGVPHGVRGAMGNELDPPGPFTLEAYLHPRDFPGSGYPPQERASVVRKARSADGTLQWAVELRRNASTASGRADLFATTTWQTSQRQTAVREVSAKGAVRLAAWQHFALVFDGKTLTLWVNGEKVASADAPGPGAKLLPSGGRSELTISDEIVVNGREPRPEQRHQATSYEGRIDELRITFAALAADQLLPLPRKYLGKEPLPVPPKRTEYTSLVRRHLEAMMKHGTDVYGPVRSPLLVSALDPATLRVLAMKPPEGEGMPFTGDNYRSPILGCNLTLMRNALMAMQATSAVTGDPRFTRHADAALRYWLKNCLYPSGVWPIGEHGLYNFHTDKPQPNRPHEPMAHLDWEAYWRLAPEAVRKELEAMHRIHVFEYKGLAFHDRHGSSEGHPHPVGGEGYARQSGLFARGWAFLYSKTKDPKHLKWAKDQLDLLWQLRDPKTGYCPGQVFPPPGDTFGGRKMGEPRIEIQPIWAALGFLDAVDWLDGPADRKLFHDRAVALAMADFNGYYQWDGAKFGRTCWEWVGETLTPDLAWLMLKFWERAGRPPELLEHLKHIAEDRIRNWLPTEGTDSGAYGWTILFFVQMRNETGDPRYLEFARRLGNYAAANLVLENGLVVGSRLYRYYDCMYHVDKLLHAFLAMDHPDHPAVKPLIREPLF